MNHKLGFILITLVSGAVYHPVLFGFFGSDDFIWLWYSQQSSDFWQALTNELALSKFRLAANLYFYLFHHIFGLQACWYHLASLGLHLFNAILFFRILLSLRVDSHLALVTSLIFSAHFALEETLFWVSAVSTLLATGLGLASLWFLLKSFYKKRRLFLGLSYLCYALALLSKEEAIAFPFIMFIVLKVIDKHKSFYDTLKLLLIPLFLSFGYVILRLFLTPIEISRPVIELNPFNAFSKLIYLIVNLCFPVRLLQDNFPLLWQDVLKLQANKLIYLLVLLVIGPMAAVLLKRIRFSTITKVGFLIFLVSSLVFIFFTGFGQRFVYVPALSFSVLVGILMNSLSCRLKRPLWVLTTIFILLCFTVIQMRGKLWKEAGYKSQKILVQMGEILSQTGEDEMVYFSNLPKVWNHVYMFHLGYPQAIQLFYPEQAEKLAVIPEASDSLIIPENVALYTHTQKGFVRLK